MPQTPQILDAALAAFSRTTGLATRAKPYKPRNGHRADAIVQIKGHDKPHQFLAEVKDVDRFATPALIKARSAGSPQPALLVAPHITRETAEHCRRLKLPFLDTAGNAYVEAKGLFVYVVGQHRPADLDRAKFRSLTPAGLQVTFAILCRPELLQRTYREIARAAKVALGTIGPTLKDLQHRGLVRLARGDAGIRDWRRLVDEWVTRFPTTLRPKLEARRFEADARTLANASLKNRGAFWGGEPGADRLTHLLRPAEFTIYTARPWAPLAAAHRLRAHPQGNVEVLKAFWDFTPDVPASDVAPPLLVYADLMATRDGRNIEIANVIHEGYIEPKFHEAR